MVKPEIKIETPSKPEMVDMPSGSISEADRKDAPPIPKVEQENETPKNELETETPQTPAAEKPEDKSKDLQSALAQKEHWREKAEKLEKRLESSNIPTGTNPMEVVRLAKALEKYNEDEVEFITRNASEKSIDGIINASQDEWVRTAIDARREKVKNENAVPEPSSPFSVVRETPIPERYQRDKEDDVRDAMLKRLKRVTKEGGTSGI